ncbi:MAG TPA: Tim44/TimA family putative adaptor protein [Roseiarcus sp.]|jgi:predicted lipid-binding transport protein (Tim44 family)
MPEIDLPTVIFAVVALFVAFKLRSVLGMRQDSERQQGGLLAPLRRAPAPPAAPLVEPEGAALAHAPPAAADRWKGVAESDPAIWSGLDAVAAADRSFSPQAFLSGARVAYDMVVHAFAAGDSATLRNLMTPEAFANFDNAIRSRAAAGQTMTTTVVSIDAASIVGAQLAGSMAQLSVRFAAKLASVTRDAQGAVVDGSPSAVADHIDLWTFSRDIRSRNPNWMLTATESESGAAPKH